MTEKHSAEERFYKVRVRCTFHTEEDVEEEFEFKMETEEQAKHAAIDAICERAEAQGADFEDDDVDVEVLSVHEKGTLDDKTVDMFGK